MAEKIIIKENPPQEVVSDHDKLIDYAKRPIRGKEEKIKSAGGSVSVRQNGEITEAAGIFTQRKLNPFIHQEEKVGFKEHTVTNEHSIEADDITINKHKLNNKIHELADYKNVLASETTGAGGVAGKLMMYGLVLTKSWDHSLQRYVLIRRMAAIPIFSPQLPTAVTLPGLNITPSTTKINEMKNAYKASGLDINTFLNKNVNAIASSNGQIKTEPTADNDKIKTTVSLNTDISNALNSAENSVNA